MDWSAAGSLTSGIAALVNAFLVVWLIRVTQQYVHINAGLLDSTRESLAVSKKQLAVDRMARIGPILAAIGDLDVTLQRWEIWSSDVREYVSGILNTTDPIVSEEFERARTSASSLSLPAYNELIMAKQQSMLFERIVREAQRSATSAAMTQRYEQEKYSLTLTVSGGRELVTQARGYLGIARKHLEALLLPMS